jgi:hypothetical protein
VDSAAAEAHVWLLAERQLRRAAASPRYRWLDEDFREGGLPPEEEGILRVRAVLSALSKVGTLSGAAAGRVLGQFSAALAARALCAPDALLGGLGLGLGPGEGTGAAGQAGSAPRPATTSPAAAAPHGRYRAIPIGAAVPAERDGYLGLLHLQALVLAPGRAAIMTTFVSSWRDPGGPAGTVPGQSPRCPPFGGSGLTDDRGRPYRLSFETGEAGWHEGGVLDLSPVPPPGTRWLDIPLGAEAIRIELTGQTPAAVRTEPRPLRAPGELLLEAVADTMLGGGPMPGIEATLLATGLAEVAEALEAAGALPPGSLAAARLARLCQRRAIEVRGRLADQGSRVDLPAPWASVLDPGQRQEGRSGVLPAAAALPEIDGARFVLAGMVSGEREAIMPVFAWGWEPRPRTFRPGQPFSWWARDNAGRWHAGRCPPYDMVAGTFQVEFFPPLDPAATSLDIILTGRSSRVTATLPLAWTGNQAKPEDQDISC